MKSWYGPFHTDYIRGHHADQHSERWAEYSEPSELKKLVTLTWRFLYNKSPLAHFNSAYERITESILRKIVEDIIDDLPEARTFLDPDWAYI